MADGFQMPPALAGDNANITPDRKGAENFAKVTGGLTAILLALGGAAYAKDRIMNVVSDKSQGDSGGISFRGEL